MNNRAGGLTAIIALLFCNALLSGFQMIRNPEHTGESLTEKSPPPYSVFDSFEDMATARHIKYFEPVRVSPAGSKTNPMYHGFFFYSCAQ